MQKEIHPEMHDVVFIDTTSGAQFVAQSTAKSEEKMKIGKKEYFVIKIEISSASHPFYTGKQTLVDTAGRVDKFMAKMKKAQEMSESKVKKLEDEDSDEEVAKETAEAPEKEEKKEEPEPIKEEEKVEAPVEEEIKEEKAEQAAMPLEEENADAEKGE